MALKVIRRLGSHHRIRLLIKNFQIVDLITRVILAPPEDFYFPSGTWAAACLSLLAEDCKLNVHPAWIKGHVGFFGNEVSGHYANWGAFSPGSQQITAPPPPSRHF